MNFIKCEKLEKSMAELQFSIDAEAFKAAVADVFKKEGKKYAVPGFRKGKAPRALIEKMYGADVFTYDAINELFPEAYEAAVKEAGIEPVGRPEVSVDSANETEGVTLTVKVAVKPEVKIGSYNGLTVEKTVHTVTDIWKGRTPIRTSACISTAPAAPSAQVWPSTIPCSISSVTSPPSAWAWPLPWVHSCWQAAPRESVSHCPTPRS